MASPAWAAFPGRDGLLAVQPVSGGGVILVSAHGGSERRICTDRSQCGTPRNPRWSPDGRTLAFNAATVHLIYPDGSCLDCQMGGAGTPAFTANPTLVTFESDGALIEDGIDDIRKATILTGTASDAVWSASGQLALVRAGTVWVGTPPHRLRRIGTGSSPSWSPSGSQLALVRKGWILVVGVSHGGARRLVRGGTPAWSPDGKSIAYIGAGHHLLVVPASGGRARRVGSVRGYAVDWQPIPTKAPAGCAVPPGSTVITSSPTGVITGESQSDQSKSTYMGCLTATGRERLLEEFGGLGADGETDVYKAAVGGDFAALANDFTDPKYGGQQVTVAVFDLRTGLAVPHRGGESVGCPDLINGCLIAGVTQIVMGSDGASAADMTGSVPPDPLASEEISCPSASLCAAADDGLLTSTDPAAGGGTWTVTQSAAALTDISCPTASFCAGVYGSFVLASTDPTGGASAWTSSSVASTGDRLDGISCPSASLCVAVDDTGNVYTTTDPTGGTGTWTHADVDGTNKLGTITCQSTSLCVATDYSGDAIVSSDPTGGAGAWQTATAFGQQPGYLSVSCPSPTLCVAVDGTGGDAFTTTDPSSAALWSAVAVPGEPNAVSCPSISLCLAVGAGGALDVSTDPTGGTWTSTEIDNGQSLLAIACATSTLCVAGDKDGYIVTSTDPTGGSAAWTAALLNGNPCSYGTFCTTEEILASDGAGVHTLDTITGPGMGSLLTELSLSGDTLTWADAGTPESATLAP